MKILPKSSREGIEMFKVDFLIQKTVKNLYVYLKNKKHNDKNATLVSRLIIHLSLFLIRCSGLLLRSQHRRKYHVKRVKVKCRHIILQATVHVLSSLWTRIINVSRFREMIRESRCAEIYSLLRLRNDLGLCSY